ncbi:DUF624 domain-containing protein [Microbacterium sp. Sa4CUA7]|uniref:DUF624 domain-containing protein n=1 Tax=Microbacterium pullorum TaxID=2762236 RepID=A0ABR8S2H5_9MICO|nr:DUF624 domain-containing protein [Microbacterium pullorum]MBD7957681.1 DUF624 domain-containing protein [Microbacterium pullorum]
MTTPIPAGTWALRVHAACDWVMWTMTVNALVIASALAGGIVLGTAPAVVTATALTRRRLRGEAFPVIRTFAGTWRDEFWRANAVVGPPLAVTALLTLQVAGSASGGTLGTASGVALCVAAVLAFLVTAVVTPLYTHYDLPLRAYLPTASRWMLRNAAPVLLLAVAAAGVIGISALIPGLVPFVSVGAWLTISTALAIGLFTANDRLVASPAP